MIMNKITFLDGCYIFLAEDCENAPEIPTGASGVATVHYCY
jgi:hypothetical protein